MAGTFGEFLREAVERRGMSLHAYAAAVGLGKSHSFAYRVARGAPPPLKSLDRWAAPLGLTAEERARFDLLAAVANSPPAVRDWFARAEKDLAEAQKR